MFALTLYSVCKRAYQARIMIDKSLSSDSKFGEDVKSKYVLGEEDDESCEYPVVSSLTFAERGDRTLPGLVLLHGLGIGHRMWQPGSQIW